MRRMCFPKLLGNTECHPHDPSPLSGTLVQVLWVLPPGWSGGVKRYPSTQHPSCLFFQYNTQLGPPYHILVDTNFINFSIKAKLDLVQSMMDCLYAKCIPCITDCVMAEIEKLGQKYRVALRIAKDPRFERLPCTHKGTYADDCLVQRVTQHKCYIVATVDRDLKRRIRKIPGVPIMYISNHR
ncbi:rRNA-processing protein FCF1 [Galemys pyrenaicus]|uniref:rRNA-processing protein FCF1 homolog n=1 Tax=Galemys pyrenaicus TaxID=202257 RepID=A0A8J6A8Y8_GALPY|nr:rRNA-processing protein FCF1 [Galemys pyrenaicus]